MAIRNSLIIIVGSLLALPDISSCLPASRHPLYTRWGTATSLTTSASTKTAIRHYMAAPTLLPNSRQKEREDVIYCKVILWKLFCRVRIIQATTSTPATIGTSAPRTTTASPLKRMYAESRIIVHGCQSLFLLDYPCVL